MKNEESKLIGIIVSINFFEAHFKVHITKGFKLTYPMPLPTSVAGIFGAMLGIDRKDIIKEFQNFLFGAKLVSYDGTFHENITFIQYKQKRIEKGVVNNLIINNPSYKICMAGAENKIREIYNNLKHGIKYFPYGGQNDFFTRDINLVSIREVYKEIYIENYAPKEYVENVELRNDSELYILPVGVNEKFLTSNVFYFIFNGRLKLKNPVYCADGIGLYPLNYFIYLE